MPKIKIGGNPPTTNPSKILEAFQGFYSRLYEPHTRPTTGATSQFLEGLHIPTLSTDHRDILDSPITEEEVVEVVRGLRTGSAPGPDGLSIPYYKTFSAILAPHMTKFFNSKTRGDPLDSQINTAFITVIPKPDKNPEDVRNYRPISLINNDLKVLTKILANRLAGFIGQYIHKDQVGFIPGRQGPDQIRRAIDLASIMLTNWTGGIPQRGFLLSLDLQKAFDSVSWPYLFNLLETWGFGPRFLGIIRALYANPRALVRINGHYSKPIEIRRGTRQGCPLSPLVFAVAIETLAIAIRQNPNISGVQCGDQTHKCALFADDILLFLTSPVTTLPNLCHILDDFSRISGLSVNFSKSQALNISLPSQIVLDLKQSFNFSWNETSIQYLGIALAAKTEALYDLNYPPLYKKMEADLKIWSRFNLSWLGRINSVKMTLFPRILYLFRSLPIPIRRNHLKSLQSKLLKFIWGTSGYRVPHDTLIRH